MLVSNRTNFSIIDAKENQTLNKRLNVSGFEATIDPTAEWHQIFMRRTGQFFVNHTMNLLQFLHQIALRMEPPRCVNKKIVCLSCTGRSHGIVRHGGGIGCMLIA